MKEATKRNRAQTIRKRLSDLRREVRNARKLLPRRLFHYTTREPLERILADGEIRRSEEGQDEHNPAVWFSWHPVWEPTASKKWVDNAGRYQWGNRDTTHKHYGGLFRIEVPVGVAPHDWNSYKRTSGRDRDDLCELVLQGYEVDARPTDWRCSYERVPTSEFIAIEYWDSAAWKLLPEWCAVAGHYGSVGGTSLTR